MIGVHSGEIVGLSLVKIAIRRTMIVWDRSKRDYVRPVEIHSGSSRANDFRLSRKRLFRTRRYVTESIIKLLNAESS